MKKLLSALLVAGALVMTAAPASATTYVTLWHSGKARLAGIIFITQEGGCVPGPSTGGCLVLGELRFTNTTGYYEKFSCSWRDRFETTHHWSHEADPYHRVFTHNHTEGISEGRPQDVSCTVSQYP